ncbi:hypothetical protein B0G80_2051 [Paraburkholderia sp. BL6669N2]|nr:hypothetical protein B0G80_2051 [Paraburkholderia sp. BL6669N2]
MSTSKVGLVAAHFTLSGDVFPASPQLKLPLGVIGKKCLSDLTIVHSGRHMLAPPGLPVIHCARYTRRDVVLP